jgi:hypothetical protein
MFMRYSNHDESAPPIGLAKLSPHAAHRSFFLFYLEVLCIIRPGFNRFLGTFYEL